MKTAEEWQKYFDNHFTTEREAINAVAKDAYNQALEDVIKAGSNFKTNKEIVDVILAFIAIQCRSNPETKGGLKGK